MLSSPLQLAFLSKTCFNMSFKWIYYPLNYVDPGLAAAVAAKNSEETSASVVAAANCTQKTNTSAVCYIH